METRTACRKFLARNLRERTSRWRPVLELLESRLAPANLVLQAPNDVTPDTIELLRDGTNLRVVINAGTPTDYDFSTFDDIEVIGNDEGTTLIVDNGGGVIDRQIDFQANNVFPLDILVIEGNAGTIARETYTTGASQGDGTIVIDPDGIAGNGDEGTIVFTGVTRVDDTLAAVASLDIHLTGGNDFVNIVNGNVVSGFNTTGVNSGNGLFTSIQLANKATVNVSGRDGADTFNLNNTTPGSGLVNLNVFGNDSTGVAADDNAADAFNVMATPAAVTTTLAGEGGDDLMQVSNAGMLDGILGNLDLQAGGGASNVLIISDAADPDGDANVVVTSNQITGLAPATISYSTTGGFSSVNIFAGGGNDTINVQGTLAASAFTQVDAGDGNDVINVSSDAPANAGRLDNIQGFLLIRGGGGANQLNVSDAGDPDADTNVVLETMGNGAQITGLAPVTIAYEDLAGNFGNGVNVTGGTAGDTFFIRGTLANAPLTVNGGGGDDIFNLGNVGNSLDSLAASSPLAILGGAGSNTLNVNDQGDPDPEVITVTSAGITGMAPVTISYSATGSFGGGINLHGSQAGNSYGIQSTLAGGTTTIVAQNSDDNFNVTSAGSLDGLAGNLDIQAGGGAMNSLNVSDVLDPDADTNVVITSSQITGLAPATISYSTTGQFDSVQITAGTGDDTLSVQSTLAAAAVTIVDAGAGNDTINVSSTAGDLDGILGTLDLRGGTGLNTAIISDQGGSTANASVVVTSVAITGFAGPADDVPIVYGAVGGALDLTLRGSDNLGDVFHVRENNANVSLTVVTGAGDDTVNVGNAASSLDDVIGPLQVLMGAGSGDALHFNDQGEASPHSYIISAAHFIRIGTNVVTYGNVEQLTANTGSDDDSIAITSTSAAVTVNAGAGADDFAVDSNGFADGGQVALIQHAVTLNGGSGSNLLTISNSDHVTRNNVVHLTATQVGADPNDHFFGPGGSLTYSDLEFLTLHLANATVGDVVHVVPSMTTEFFIHGGLPIPPTTKGDVLLVDTTGTTNPVLTPLPGQGNGEWTFDDRATVHFTGIEGDELHSIIVVGEGRNRQGRVQVFDALTQQLLFTLQPFGNFKGRVRVAAGDVTGDGIPDIIAGKGPGYRSNVKVFDGDTGLLVAGAFSNLQAFGNGFRGGVFVAAGDLNEDGFAEVFVSQGSQGSKVRIFDGATGLLLDTLSPFGASKAGTRIAAGDLTGDGRADIVTGMADGKARVRVFDGATLAPLPGTLGKFQPFGGKAGVYVAAGDVDGDGRADVLVGSGSKPIARVYSGQDGTLLGQLNLGGKGAVKVAAADATGAQRSDLVVTRFNKSGQVQAFDGGSLGLLDSFFALTGSPEGLSLGGG